MEQFVELLKQVNIAQIFVVFAGFWVFYSRLDKKIEKLDERLTKRVEEFKGALNKQGEEFKGELNKLSTTIDKRSEEFKEALNKQSAEFKGELNKLSTAVDKLSEKVEDIDRRLCRIEGSLATHGHCLFNQAIPEKKAG